jgi:hypothetical protein
VQGVSDNSGTERVEVDIAHQFQQVGITVAGIHMGTLLIF